MSRAWQHNMLFSGEFSIAFTHSHKLCKNMAYSSDYNTVMMSLTYITDHIISYRFQMFQETVNW